MDAVNERAEKLEAAAREAEKPPQEKPELDKSFVLERLRRNRVVDDDLFATLFRGKYVFAEEWGSWLYWTGHYWNFDMISKRALADVERVCAAYQNAWAQSGEAEGSPLHKLFKSRMERLRILRYRESRADRRKNEKHTLHPPKPNIVFCTTYAYYDNSILQKTS